MKKTFKIIGFDADDTLWVNEPLYRKIEEEFSDLKTHIFGISQVLKPSARRISTSLTYLSLISSRGGSSGRFFT